MGSHSSLNPLAPQGVKTLQPDDTATRRIKSGSIKKLTLVGLPAEIQNDIFGLAVTTSTPIMIRIETRPAPTGTAYRVQPGLPALASVCRELRSVVPSLYYALNTFYFTDKFFHSNGLEKFLHVRGTNVRFMGAVIARHTGKLIEPIETRGTPEAYPYQIGFSADLAIDGTIALSKCTSSLKRPKLNSPFGTVVVQDAVCTCALEDLAVAQSTTREEALKEGRLLSLLAAYSSRLMAYKGTKHFEVCDGCGKLRAV